VLSQQQSFVLDGTLSKFDKACDNINRSLHKNRSVFVFYIYQNPKIAWLFTKEREKRDGRNIPKQVFIDQFLDAKNTTQRIRRKFDKKVTIFLVQKDYEKNTEMVVEINQYRQQLDDIVKESYTENDLNKLL
jgi:UDP-N-acetylglucosamine kinase